MSRFTKKSLAMILSFAMVLSLMSVTAFADDVVPAPTPDYVKILSTSAPAIGYGYNSRALMVTHEDNYEIDGVPAFGDDVKVAITGPENAWSHTTNYIAVTPQYNQWLLQAVPGKTDTYYIVSEYFKPGSSDTTVRALQITGEAYVSTANVSYNNASAKFICAAPLAWKDSLDNVAGSTPLEWKITLVGNAFQLVTTLEDVEYALAMSAKTDFYNEVVKEETSNILGVPVSSSTYNTTSWYINYADGTSFELPGPAPEPVDEIVAILNSMTDGIAWATKASENQLVLDALSSIDSNLANLWKKAIKAGETFKIDPSETNRDNLEIAIDKLLKQAKKVINGETAHSQPIPVDQFIYQVLGYWYDAPDATKILNAIFELKAVPDNADADLADKLLAIKKLVDIWQPIKQAVDDKADEEALKTSLTGGQSLQVRITNALTNLETLIGTPPANIAKADLKAIQKLLNTTKNKAENWIANPNDNRKAALDLAINDLLAGYKVFFNKYQSVIQSNPTVTNNLKVALYDLSFIDASTTKLNDQVIAIKNVLRIFANLSL